jgi:hypothetical protein
MFIVAMTTAVLASVGVFALVAAATEVRASGNERQATQTHFLAQYGMVAGANDLSSPGKASLYYSMMMSTSVTVHDNCDSLPNVTFSSNLNSLQKACKAIEPTDLALSTNLTPLPQVLDSYDGGVAYQAGTPAGSLGPVPVQGGFRVELTDPTKPPPPAGYGMNSNICFYGYTMSSKGQTQPNYGAGNVATYAGLGTEIQRGRVTAGPDQCL